jgi:hypothetical protein
MATQYARQNATNSELDAKQIITNEDKMARMLRLNNDQFDALYDVVEETIINIRENIEDTDLELDDYEIYEVWNQLNKIRGKS